MVNMHQPNVKSGRAQRIDHALSSLLHWMAIELVLCALLVVLFTKSAMGAGCAAIAAVRTSTLPQELSISEGEHLTRISRIAQTEEERALLAAAEGAPVDDRIVAHATSRDMMTVDSLCVPLAASAAYCEYYLLLQTAMREGVVTSLAGSRVQRSQLKYTARIEYRVPDTQAPEYDGPQAVGQHASYQRAAVIEMEWEHEFDHAGFVWMQIRRCVLFDASGRVSSIDGDGEAVVVLP